VRRIAAGTLLALSLGAAPGCGRESTPSFSTRERMQGRALVVEIICEEAIYEDVFVQYLVSRVDTDRDRHPHMEEYRFRLSLIPEGEATDEPISVLFSYIFYNREAKRTSNVEAFEFLVPVAEAGAMGAAGPTVRRQIYESLREQQPELNPDFARRRSPSPEDPDATAI
jgi:hypothetical protein